MTLTWKHRALFVGLLLGGCHLVWAAEAKAPVASNLDDQWVDDVAEVPVESIQQFVQIYGVVKQNYVSEKSDDALFLQATKGLVSGLDRYSRYLSPEEYRQLIQYTEGDLATVDFNVFFDATKSQWIIRNLTEDADSYKLGLKNGSTIYKIDSQEIKNLNQHQVKDLLDGSIGSTVQVQQTASSRVFTLVRNKKLDVADIQPILLNNQILVIKVKVFQQDTANQLKKIIDEYQSNKIKGVLLDLRNNPGGLLSSAVESADLFLNQGLIVSTKSRSEGDQEFQALPGNEFSQLKLGVLINGRSASAAEVFTAAMKEHQRAVIIGEKSYGKGVVQKLFPLSDGAALQMTVSHYFTPKGNLIDGQGIRPNIELPLTAEMKEENYLNHAAEQLLKSKI
ncbi:S41 family peptidase [Acinetobacter shaoyimingii]|uniref:S41 family peptidase n=1 Tax=Acinetobacter shaoyimingii TaxID=2715164 RepID=A0A6G8RZ44_9GAMM|nr:S41 family peptidase [Acinetobacter shaoyimingii]QIO07134.1 S41 family peptidase [Acinetobacter shaoyimingii]